MDDISLIPSVVRDRGRWLHVDGAFGLWAATSDARRHLIYGIDNADSLAADAHKWLNAPYDCGIVLTAHPDEHTGRFSYLHIICSLPHMSATHGLLHRMNRAEREGSPSTQRYARLENVECANWWTAAASAQLGWRA